MIGKEPKKSNVFTNKIYFAKAARITFSHILKHLFSATDKKILMPSYIGETDEEGSGVFDPLRQNSVPFEFYRINPDLSADMNDLRTKIRSGRFRALLIIHYFGFVQNDLEEISKLCQDHDVIFIEDCAHTFHSTYKRKNVGTWGDLSFYSIHKIIATADGGYFRINRENIPVPEFDIPEKKPALATFEEYIRTDYDTINEIRITNYSRYLECLNDIPRVFPLFPVLPEGIVPLNFPIRVCDGLREKLYFKLVEKGIVPCSLYYRMVHEIDRNLYPVSYEISDSILNLPVHQDTGIADVERVVHEVRKSMAEIDPAHK